jgi:DNA-binding GntR family transcriptional regulator
VETYRVIPDVQRIEVPLSLSEMAYVSIKKSIMNMDWSDVSASARFDERRVAERLGVSRTPLREAVKRLVIEGFLRVEPRKGLFIVKKSKTDMIEILLVRSALEGLAARLGTKLATKEDIGKMKKIFSSFAVKSNKDISGIFSEYSEANIEFHEFIIQLSRCRKLIEMANGLFDHMRWIRSWSIYNTSFRQRFSKIHKEHLGIIKAIERRDPDLAEKRIKAHIEGLALYLEQDVNFLA